MDFNNLIVTKEDGKKEPFSIQKFRTSLQRAHLQSDEIDHIVKTLEQKVFPGISTREIYRMASHVLKETSPSNAARYSLKKAIMELGPSGFPFERFIARLFEFEGFETEVGITMQGHCISHELDVVGKRGNELMLVECKYHKQAGIYVEVKVPMYIHSRFNDLLDNNLLETPNTVFQGWIATNSRFSFDAQAFGLCKGMHLLSWDFPKGNSLKDRIDQSGLYPLTCLTSLSFAEKQYFLENEKVLAKDLLENEEMLLQSGISRPRLEGITREINSLVSPPS